MESFVRQNLDGAKYSFDKLLLKWKAKLNDAIDLAVKAEKDVYVICMSRKMPRLLEWIDHDTCGGSVRGYGLQESYICNNGCRIEYITEHAIPFVFSHVDRPFEVIIIDDVIVYGGTIEKAAMEVYAFTRHESIALPIIAGKLMKNIRYVRNMQDLFDSAERMENLPFYTHIMSQIIAQRGGPIDMEFPLFNLPIDAGSADSIMADLFVSMKTCFGESDVYMIEHMLNDSSSGGFGFVYDSRKIYSLTALLDKERPYQKGNDFAKMRVHIDNCSTTPVLYFTIYTPHIIAESDLTMCSPLFAGTNLEELWKIVVAEAEYDAPIFPEVQDLSTFSFVLDDGKKLRIMHTKAVWANYLLSLMNVSILRSWLEKSPLSDKIGSLTINKADLQWLLGARLANEVYDKILQLLPGLEMQTVVTSVYEPYRVERQLVPTEFQEVYRLLNINRTRLCDTPQEALSLMFTNQHFNVGLAMVAQRPENTDRDKFGETFVSIAETLVRFNNDPEKLMLQIHKWIDERIDLGIVVPKYEQVRNDEGQLFWRRFFRAGENEEGLIKFSRLAMDIIVQYAEAAKTNVIEESALEVLLSEKMNLNIFPLPVLTAQQLPGSDSMRFYIAGSQQVRFLDYLDVIRVIDKFEIGDARFVRICQTSLVETLTSKFSA